MQRKPYAEIGLVALGTILYFMANLQRVAVPGAIFDVLAQDLKTSAHTITALSSIYMYSYAFGQLIIGVLVARFGGFRVVTAGSILFFIGCLIFPCASDIPLLYTSRLLIGLGSASFYLGLINETRRLFSRKNFGLVISLILFVGYTGGIVANAPLVLCIHKMGWRDVFLITGIITAVAAGIFILLDRAIKHEEPDKSVHMDLELFKHTFNNHKNLSLYAFACTNYGLYFVLQAVIGKKFLEDFCNISAVNAAAILSIMAFLYAIAGPVIAFFSRLSLNKRTIFLKLSSINTLLVFGFIMFCAWQKINSPLIYIGFCTVAFGASLSPILIPLLHDYNGQKVANTAVSILPCGFYLVVAVLSGIIGRCLDYFNNLGTAYIAIFTIMFFVAIFSFINVFKIKESLKTIRLIEHIHYLSEHEHYEDNE